MRKEEGETAMSTITNIKTCATTSCAYNADGCTAFAVTIAGAEKASCITFLTLDARGGLPTADGHVGACQRLECIHNADLMCTAEGVGISDSAACLTYQAR